MVKWKTIRFGLAATNNPNVLLVKRITAINGLSTNPNDNTNLSGYIDESANIYDDNTDDTPGKPGEPEDTTFWPDPDNSGQPDEFLTGAIDGGVIKPDDEIEYTIYFLSTGDVEARSVLFCDRVPEFVEFLPDAFESGKGITVSIGGDEQNYTNIGGDDIAQYIPPE